MVSFRPPLRFNRALGRHVLPVESSGTRQNWHLCYNDGSSFFLGTPDWGFPWG